MTNTKYKVGDVLWAWDIDDDFGPRLISYQIEEISKSSNGSFVYYTNEFRGGRYYNTLLADDEEVFTSDVEALLDMLTKSSEAVVKGCTLNEIYRLCLKTILNKLKETKCQSMST